MNAILVGIEIENEHISFVYLREVYIAIGIVISRIYLGYSLGQYVAIKEITQ